MRLRTTTVLSLSALAVLALTGCSTGSADSTDPASSTIVSVRPEGESASASAPLSSAALAKLLVNESDLGEGYTRMPQRSAQYDNVTVIGCPVLEKLGSDAAVGGSLDFPHKAKASFAYAGGSDSVVTEELYSDTEDKLSRSVDRIFEAMTSCPAYQVLTGSAPVTVTTQKVLVAQLGDEQWSQLLTFTAGGRSSTVKQTAVRTGDLVVVVSGSPGLVDAHVHKAVAKATWSSLRGESAAASVLPQRRPTGWAAVGVRPVSCLRARRGIRGRFVRRRSGPGARIPRSPRRSWWRRCCCRSRRGVGRRTS